MEETEGHKIERGLYAVAEAIGQLANAIRTVGAIMEDKENG